MKLLGQDDPSIKERKLIAGVLEGKPVSTAAREAGYGDHYSDSQIRHTINKPRVQKALVRAMEMAGIDDESLARLIKKGLYAKKAVYHQGVEIAREADPYARHQYIRTALEIRGDIGAPALRPGEDETWEATLIQIRARRSIPADPPPIDLAPTPIDPGSGPGDCE